MFYFLTMVQYSRKSALLHYIVGKLRCCLPPPSPQNLYCPFSSNLTNNIRFVFFWNFLWQYKLFVFIWSRIQAFDSCNFNCLDILLLALLFTNYIQFFQYAVWCFLTKKKMRMTLKYLGTPDQNGVKTLVLHVFFF